MDNVYDPNRPLSYLGPQTPGRKRVAQFGDRISIICRICEKTICMAPYTGFSTAICAVCQGQVDAGKRSEDIMAQIREQDQKQVAEVYNDLGPASFKASGLRRRIKEVVEKVKQVAASRKRGSLFSKKDDLDEPGKEIPNS